MEGFVGGLALAFISGMAWLAYKHPVGFHPIGGAMILIATVALMCVIAYEIGAQAVSVAVRDYIEPRFLLKALKAESAVSPNMLLWFVGYTIAMLYVATLLALPRILGLPEKDQPHNERD